MLEYPFYIVRFSLLSVSVGKSIYLENRRYILSCADIFKKSLIYFEMRRYIRKIADKNFNYCSVPHTSM
ncbi:hypothetical protein BCE_1962 [Bacillus cereus ATCC 10987]|uniref:Uncharacterized protein n=1 Tax=Bacillus cereus (strain ATCC 10987 / NRS 248) TaxID=222523 RepID=Q73A24_BACC1|nr:hypothetical protein BCE_1962 [Bacillus cereus ATCC 10987]